MYTEDKLIKEIETRFKTLMIGSISRFENTFGHLWNHGDEPNTQSEEQFLDKWESLRTDLLNHGNNQIRLAIDELSKFLNSQNKFNYNYKFYMNNNKENRR